MSQQKSPLKFDHREIAVLFSLFVFVSLLMFTVGIVVGKGLAQSRYEALLLQPHGQGMDGHAPHSDGLSKSHETPQGTHITTPPHEEEPVHDERTPAEAEKTEDEGHDAHGSADSHDEQHAASDTDHHREPAKAAEKEPLKLIPKEASSAELAAANAGIAIDPKGESKGLLKNPRIRRLIDGLDKSATHSKPKATLPSSHSKGEFTVQVGSYPTKKDAVERVAKLKKIGFPHAYLSVKQFGTGKETWYRVWLGFYSNKEDAKKSGEILQQRGEVSNYLVRKSDQSG